MSEVATTRTESGGHQIHDDHHRDFTTGSARAAVFGVMDGLVSNVGLILGFAGAGPSSSVVRLAGIGGLIAGAVSMAAGEYNSMRAQTELFEAELDLERTELAENTHFEQLELAQIYQSRGVPTDDAHRLAATMMRDPELALRTHAREELGIDPDAFGSPVKAAVSSFVSFVVGALVPLLPWFFGSGTAATVASVLLGVVGAAVVGVVLTRFTGRSRVRTAGRHVVISAAASAIGYGVGSLVGAGTSIT